MLGQTHGFPRREFIYSRGLVIQGGTVALAGTQPFVSLAGTWNTSGVATALKLNVTNTASGASSLLCDFQTGGVSQFKVDKAGATTTAGALTVSSGGITITAGGMTVSSGNVTLATGSITLTSGGLTANIGTVTASILTAATINGVSFMTLQSGCLLTWSGRSLIGSLSDGNLVISNNATADFSLLQFGGITSSFPAIGRNSLIIEVLAADGASKAAFAVYNTKTSTTNFERLDIQWATNVCQLWTEKGSGGGTARDLVLGADATELHRFQTGSKQSFFAATPVVQQTSGANLTNNVTAGGTTDQIDNFTDLVIYANDAAAIRNDIYQLARKLKQINDGLRAYGLFT